ncbi:MAG: DUF5320 domain-containing protein [bacterium]
MPGFDGTGPTGQGPRTGRGMGNCNQVQSQDCGRGQGFGRGSGMGRGKCRFANSNEAITVQDRLEVLKANKKRLEAEIEALEKGNK